MFVRRSIPWTWTLYYAWPSLLYFLMVASAVYVLRRVVHNYDLEIPFEPVTIMATALAIFLGFKNNEAYGRWWEARKIWGLAVNYSRAWARQVLTLIHAPEADRDELLAVQRRLVYRHMGFIHALRVFLRTTKSYPLEVTSHEPGSRLNDYETCREFLSEEDFQEAFATENPPEALLQIQGRELHDLYVRGWISDIILAQLDQTLVEMNHIQGKSERIKLTPLPRPYSYFQRLIVHVHGTLLPFAFVASTGWLMIPLSFSVSFVFLALDLIGSRTEDPFENRVDDMPLSALSRTIERNLKVTLGDNNLPPKVQPEQGVLL